MRVSDRDLIRGKHYGQRSCEPHSKAEHMAAPTTCDVKILLANLEPSTHGPKLPTRNVRYSVAMGAKADVRRAPLNGRFLTRSQKSRN
jgi:hypothetical protein